VKLDSENIGLFISKNPDAPILINHEDGKFTFHNVNMRQAMWFALKSTYQSFNKRRKERQRLARPVMQRIMGQFSKKDKPKGEIDPNKIPPRGMRINWNSERGYHYSKQSEAMTNNQGIKQSNLMPKKKGD